jgi:MoaA/NifB/PqqE/SkfB family radical SAM enzyme
MTYNINWLEWEVTTACNAACPQCPRNYYGGRTLTGLPIIQNTRAWAEKHIPVSFIQQLSRVDFCGTYGDAIMNNDLPNIINWLRTVNPDLEITLKTNGSLRNTKWWAELANLIGQQGGVFFAIDGLEDTNHIYRRKTDFKQIMENAQAFIDAGGIAHWNYIVFKHNQHQVQEARELSERMGFKNFNTKITGRFFNKAHELDPVLTVYNDNNEPEYTIEIPNDPAYTNTEYSKLEFMGKDDFKKSTIHCKNKNWGKVYLAAEGFVFPCGWLHDRMYGYEAEQHNDYEQLEKLFEQAGGRHSANVNYTKFEQIINGPWFDTIQNSWTNTEQRLNRCEVICGDQIDIVTSQNRLLQSF